jgi:hypothetical protein
MLEGRRKRYRVWFVARSWNVAGSRARGGRWVSRAKSRRCVTLAGSGSAEDEDGWTGCGRMTNDESREIARTWMERKAPPARRDAQMGRIRR